MSANLTFLLEFTDAVSSGLKRRETFQCVISVQFKSQHLWWYGCISAYKCIRYGLACFGRHYECWEVYKGLEQHMLPSRRRLFQGSPCVFQQDNAKPHTAAITPTWLQSLGAELACLQSRSFTYREHLAHHWTKNQSKKTTNSSAARKIYQARMGPNSNTKTAETHNLNAQMSSNYFEKKRRCYGNLPLSQRFWDLFQASNLKLAHFVHNIWNVLVKKNVMLAMFYFE